MPSVTCIYMAPPAYLLIGCLIMLGANEIVHGCVTRKEFVRGMLVWPIFLVYMLEFFFSALLTRLRG